MRIFEDFLDDRNNHQRTERPSDVLTKDSDNIVSSKEWYDDVMVKGFDQILVLVIGNPKPEEIGQISENFHMNVRRSYRHCSDVQTVVLRDNEYAEYPGVVSEKELDVSHPEEYAVIDEYELFYEIDYTPVYFKVAFSDPEYYAEKKLYKFFKTVARCIASVNFRNFKNITVLGYKWEGRSWILNFNGFNPDNYDYSYEIYKLFYNPESSQMYEICQDDENELFYQLYGQLGIPAETVMKILRTRISKYGSTYRYDKE